MDLHTMAALAAAYGLGARKLDELAPLDAEELAMLQETDKALGVVRDRREAPRFGFYFHDEGEA